MLENIFHYHGERIRDRKFLFYLAAVFLVSLAALWVLY